jgi:hypothetical protein
MTTPAAHAIREYERIKARTGIALGQRRADPASVDRLRRAWLAIVLCLGADHPDADNWVDQELAETPHWGRPAARAIVAARLSSPADRRAAFERLRDSVFAQITGHEPAPPAEPAANRWRQLRAIGHALGFHSPVKPPPQPAPASPVGSQPGDRAMDQRGTGHPILQEQAA